MAAVTVRSVASGSGSGTSITIPAPSGVLSTDTVYAILLHKDNVHFPSGWPDGWADVAVAGGGGSTLRLFRRNGTVSGSWTFVADISTPYVVVTIAVMAPVVAGTPAPQLDVAVTLGGSTAGGVTVPTATPAAPDDLLLEVVSWARGSSFTAPTGVTERADLRTGDTASDLTLWVGSEELVGGSGTVTTTRTITNDNPFSYSAAEYLTATFAIKSAVPASSWSGDFETGDLSQYAVVLRESADRIEMRTDSPRQGTTYARFTAHQTDLSYALNPRAQIQRTLFYPGMTRWISWSTRFPASFPVLVNPDPNGNPTGTHFLLFAQIHGAPWNGSPQVAFYAEQGDRVTMWSSSSTLGRLWSAPFVRDAWMDFALRIYFAQDASGWVELYLNGVQQTFVDGSRRLYMKTVQSDQNSGCDWIATLYRARAMPLDSVTLDHDGHRADATPPASLTAAQTSSPAAVLTGSATTVRARLV